MTDELGDASESALWGAIKNRCDAAGIEYEERMGSTRTPGSRRLEPHLGRVISFPAGPTTRKMYISWHELESLHAIPFEHYCFLGDYHAIWNKELGSTETLLVVDTHRLPFMRSIWGIPNLEDLDSRGDATSHDEESIDTINSQYDSAARGRYRLPKSWRIQAREGTLSIELSPPSTEFRRLIKRERYPQEITLKLSGIANKEYDTVLRLMREVGNALTFELDARNDIQLTFARTRWYGVPTRRKTVSNLPMRFPVARYPEEPLELFQYGRASSALPLLQFLAYYQVVEYFFPIYSRREVASRLRIALKQPKFDVNDDIALSQVLSSILPEGKNFISERDQLRHTLHGCLDPEAIREIIEASEEYVKHFTAKNQSIRGVGRILLYDRQPDLRDQAADRIYAIRCRVVHAKQEGGESGVDLLLPSSPETSFMLPEIDLMGTVAQQVLAVAGQTPRFW